MDRRNGHAARFDRRADHRSRHPLAGCEVAVNEDRGGGLRSQDRRRLPFRWRVMILVEMADRAVVSCSARNGRIGNIRPCQYGRSSNSSARCFLGRAQRQIPLAPHCFVLCPDGDALALRWAHMSRAISSTSSRSTKSSRPPIPSPFDRTCRKSSPRGAGCSRMSGTSRQSVVRLVLNLRPARTAVRRAAP